MVVVVVVDSLDSATGDWANRKPQTANRCSCRWPHDAANLMQYSCNNPARPSVTASLSARAVRFQRSTSIAERSS